MLLSVTYVQQLAFFFFSQDIEETGDHANIRHDVGQIQHEPQVCKVNMEIYKDYISSAS